MSSLKRSTEEDYPAAAAKHLDDAELLLNQGRFDAAAYLVGYVIECALKTVIMVGELERLGEIKPDRLWPEPRGDLHSASHTFKRLAKPVHDVVRGSGRGHHLDDMVDATVKYATIPNAITALYVPEIDKKTPPFDGAWTEKLRYYAARSVSEDKARAWFDEAKRIYLSTVGRMVKEGRVRL